jgi:hypothetical protein
LLAPATNLCETGNTVLTFNSALDVRGSSDFGFDALQPATVAQGYRAKAARFTAAFFAKK